MLKRALPWLLLLALSMIWGSSFILIKRGLESFNSYSVGALRIGIGALILLPYGLRVLRVVPFRKWIFLFIVGLVGNLIPSLLFSTAQQQINSSLSGILNALTPLFVLLIGTIFYRVSLFGWKGLGILIGFIGATLLIFSRKAGFSFTTPDASTLYILRVVLATFCYGININIIRQYGGRLSPLQLASGALALVFPFSCAVLFYRPDLMQLVEGSALAWRSFMYISVLGAFGTALGFLIFVRLVNLTGPLFTSSVTYLIPVVSILWGLLDGEKILLGHYVGVALILVGIFLTSKPERDLADST